MSLKYKIGADVQGFQQGVTYTIQGFSELEHSSGKSFKNVQKNANGGALALNSLSQVARDLPFGFVAIQNNLPIVFDQFAALTKQSGGLVNGLKSVGAALAGPAGISFLAGAAIAGVTALIQKYGSLSAALTELASSSDKAAVRQRELNSAIVDAESSTAGEVAKINSLVGVLNNSNNSQLQRINAYKELKKEFPGVIQNLSLENALTKQGGDIVNFRANQLIEYIKLKGKESALTKLIAENTEKELKSAKSAVDLIQNQGTALNQLISAFLGGGNVSLGFTRRINSLGKEFEKGASDTEFFANELDKLQAQLQSFDRDLTNFKEPKTPAAPKVGARVRVAAPLVELVPEKITLDQNAINDAIVSNQFTIENGIEVPVKLTFPENVRREFSEFADKQLADLQSKLDLTKQFSDQLAAQLSQSFSDVFSSLGEGIGNVLSGIGTGFSAAQLVLTSIADVLINVGKLAIQTGVAILGIKKALQNLNPAVAIAGGVALVALGTAVKGRLANSVPKFAEGGIVTRPTAGIFGEAGPEAIMPLDKLNALIGSTGGGNTNIQGEFILRGDNLYATVQRAAQRQGRVF